MSNGQKILAALGSEWEVAAALICSGLQWVDEGNLCTEALAIKTLDQVSDSRAERIVKDPAMFIKAARKWLASEARKNEERCERERLEREEASKLALVEWEAQQAQLAAERQRRAEEAARERARQEEERERENQERLERQRKAAEERHRQQVVERTPAEYRHMTSAGSPRPRQYDFVVGYDDAAGDRDLSGEKHYRDFLLFGPSRTGKTGVCWELFRRAWLDYRDPEFIRTVTLVRLAKGRHQSKEAREEFDEVFNRTLECGFLILDDLGTEKLSESAEEVLYEVIDRRTNEHLPTVISSNLSPKQLAAKFPNSKAKMMGRLDQYFLPVNFTEV